MDPKTQGGNGTPPPVLSGAATGDREMEGGGGKKEEEEEESTRDRDKDGAATVSTGGTGASGPGDAGDDQSHFSIRESSVSEGNVKLKIGLQAKRMKKPPKILENYVCRPAFRATVRHTGRGSGSSRAKGAATNEPGGLSQSPSQGREKEKDKSPGINRPAPSSSSTASAKAPTPPPTAPALASSATVPPAQVNGSALTKRVILILQMTVNLETILECFSLFALGYLRPVQCSLAIEEARLRGPPGCPQ